MNSVEDFPDPELATEEGLLALGGDLGIARLLKAYQCGIFPWYHPGEPILWWSPDPRCVLYPDHFRPSRSLRKSIRKNGFRFTFDQDFENVIEHCAAPRTHGSGTWITEEMKAAYLKLHQLGYAHSTEVWKNGQLAGGLYGIAMGGMYFGESMFTLVTDASKAALYCLSSSLATWRYHLIDCQVTSPHLLSLGATEIPRREFLETLARALSQPGKTGTWSPPEAKTPFIVQPGHRDHSIP